MPWQKELQVLITKRLLRLQNGPADELGLKAYKQNGISIDDDHESVSKTVEIMLMMIGVSLKWSSPK
jgi:hypothetical protein